MKRVFVLTPMDVPDDTDPARVLEAVKDTLNDDDGNARQWGDWQPGDAVLIRGGGLDSYGPGTSLLDGDQ